MAYGMHWEWRGFGSVPDALRARIETLVPQFDAPGLVTDQYLWIPGVSINLKLRSTGDGTLKFKRLGQRDGTGLELWHERADEEYAFPLAPDVATSVGRALGVSIAGGLAPVGRQDLLNALRTADARICVVEVRKLRRARYFPTPHGRLIVEIAEIEAPERVSSIGIEDDFGLGENAPPRQLETARQSVADAVEEFGLARALTAANYLDATARWAVGESLIS